ncbi:ABC transporter permease [Chlamydiia bacterium]|jgi:ABC-2 type transport system permease protein|nr:ABC transporter permease [Chlamydiia bacterium]
MDKDLFTVQINGLIVIVTKEIKRVLRIWPQSLLPSVITTTLYILVFGKFIGQHIGSINHSTPYMQFVIPGLIMMSMIQNSYSNVVSSFFGAKFSKSIEEIVVSPLRPETIVTGYVLGGMFRSFIVGSLVFMVAYFFHPEIGIAHPATFLFSFVVTPTLFSLIGFTNSLFARNFDDISIIPTFILTPMVYLGGVFYSTKLLSPFWESLTRLNPILYLINLFRYSVIGITDDISVANAMIFLIIMTFAMAWLNVSLLRKRFGLRL